MSQWLESHFLREAVGEKMLKIRANREKLIEAWVAETGFHPSESVLVEQTLPNGIVKIWVERKGGR